MMNVSAATIVNSDTITTAPPILSTTLCDDQKTLERVSVSPSHKTRKLRISQQKNKTDTCQKRPISREKMTATVPERSVSLSTKTPPSQESSSSSLLQSPITRHRSTSSKQEPLLQQTAVTAAGAVTSSEEQPSIPPPVSAPVSEGCWKPGLENGWKMDIDDPPVVSIPQGNDPAIVSVPQEITSTSLSDQHQLITVQNPVHATNNLPSPFKNALIGPDFRENAVTNKRKKEVLPSVVTSTDYKNYLRRKIEEKAQEEESKKARAALRAQKKADKEATKLQKAAEREMKKAQAKKKKETQPKKKRPKKKTGAKKAKRADETSSGEEDEWKPDDESDGGAISVDEDDNFDISEPGNDERIEKCNYSSTSFDKTDAIREEIVQSIHEILDGAVDREIDQRSPPTHERTDFSNVNPGSSSSNVEKVESSVVEELNSDFLIPQNLNQESHLKNCKHPTSDGQDDCVADEETMDSVSFTRQDLPLRQRERMEPSAKENQGHYAILESH